MAQAKKVNTSAGVEYAGFGKRFGAGVIDWIILAVASGIVGFLAGGGSDILANFIGALIGWLYYVLMETSAHQGTVGKIVLKIKVTDMGGNKLTFGRATGRHFAKILSAIPLLIGFFMIGFTEKKQGLHDIIAKCLVVNKSERA